MRFPTATRGRRFAGHSRARLLIGASVLVLASLGQVASAQTTSKPYTANIVPHQVAAGASTAFTATLVNETGTQQLGSAEITAPAGFAISSAPGASFDASVVRLRNLAVPPGGSTSVVIQATAPCSGGTGAWQVRAKQSNNFSGQPGNDLSLRAAGSDLSTTVVGSCHLNFISQPADAAKGAVITTTPFNFPIPGGPIQVEVLDGDNVRVTSSTAAIDVALVQTSPSPPSGALSGTQKANAVAGVASFQNLSVNEHGVYTLSASSVGLGTATSGTFSIWGSAAACSPGQSCASTVAEGSFTASFSGTSTTKGLLLVSVEPITRYTNLTSSLVLRRYLQPCSERHERRDLSVQLHVHQAHDREDRQVGRPTNAEQWCRFLPSVLRFGRTFCRSRGKYRATRHGCASARLQRGSECAALRAVDNQDEGWRRHHHDFAS